MVTMAGKQSGLVDALNSLIELDFDAVEAYRAAIARVSSARDKGELGMFMADHERHTRELGEQVIRLGGRPKERGDVKAVLTQGKVVVAGLIGDKAIFMAMKDNEDDTNRAYENATARDDCDEELLALLHRNLSDERRHRSWMESRLESERRDEAHSP